MNNRLKWRMVMIPIWGVGALAYIIYLGFSRPTPTAIVVAPHTADLRVMANGKKPFTLNKGDFARLELRKGVENSVDLENLTTHGKQSVGVVAYSDADRYLIPAKDQCFVSCLVTARGARPMNCHFVPNSARIPLYEDTWYSLNDVPEKLSAPAKVMIDADCGLSGLTSDELIQALATN